MGSTTSSAWPPVVHRSGSSRERDMKILYTPLMIVPAVSDADRARILEAAGPGSRFVEAREAARQQAEIPDTDVLFGRVGNDIYLRAKQLRYYHSIAAGVAALPTR